VCVCVCVGADGADGSHREAEDVARVYADCERIVKQPSSSCGKRRQRVEEEDQQGDQKDTLTKQARIGGHIT